MFLWEYPAYFYKKKRRKIPEKKKFLGFFFIF